MVKESFAQGQVSAINQTALAKYLGLVADKKTKARDNLSNSLRVTQEVLLNSQETEPRSGNTQARALVH